MYDLQAPVIEVKERQHKDIHVTGNITTQMKEKDGQLFEKRPMVYGQVSILLYNNSVIHNSFNRLNAC